MQSASKLQTDTQKIQEATTVTQHHLENAGDVQCVIDDFLFDGEKYVEEKSSDLLDKSEYPRNGSDPGLVIIFNHFRYESDSMPVRFGTDADVNEILATLKHLNFNLSKKYCYQDLTRKDYKNKIKEICDDEKVLKDVNCLICFVLTHGDNENALCTKDATIYAEEVYEKFGDCEYLKGKPKFFIFQACKGDAVNKIEDTNKSKEETVDLYHSINNIPNDTIIAFSTIEGQVSFRQAKGTWFIQELCQNLLAFGRTEDVAKLIVRTIQYVARKHHMTINNGQEEVQKQLPSYISTLNNKFYLTKSDERLYLQQLIEENKKIKEKLNCLQQRIDDFVKQ